MNQQDDVIETWKVSIHCSGINPAIFREDEIKLYSFPYGKPDHFGVECNGVLVKTFATKDEGLQHAEQLVKQLAGIRTE